MPCTSSISLHKAAARIALIALLVTVSTLSTIYVPNVWAGTGTANPDTQTIDLTVMFQYPPPQAAVDQAIDSITEASRVLCDVTEGQVRLGTVTLRAGGCESGNCQTGLDEADVWLGPNFTQNAANSSFCLPKGACNALGTTGARVFLSRYYLDNPVVWAHELGHYIFDLNDGVNGNSCRTYRPPYANFMACGDITATHTSLMMAEGCGAASGVDYTELSTDSNYPYDDGQGSPCPALGAVFGFSPGQCDPATACDYTEGYDGYKNNETPLYDRCEAFDPSTCTYTRSGISWWSLYKFDDVLDEMTRAALTLEAVSGEPFFDTVATSSVPWVPASRNAFCNTDPMINNEVEAPNQVMLVLDRSWSMEFPESDYEKCGPGGCPEICGNGVDDDGDPMTDDDTNCATPRMDKLQNTATHYLDLLKSVPEEDIEAGVLSFACATEVEVDLQPVTQDSYDEEFGPAIDSLRGNGSTAIGDALVAAGNELDGASKAILLVTDGFNTCGQDIATAIDTLNTNDVRVYAISFGPAAGSLPVAAATAATGGHYISAPSASELAPAFSLQWAALTNAGLHIPKLPYRVSQNAHHEPTHLRRSGATWAAGDHQPPATTYLDNNFQIFVEKGTQTLLVSLAGDHENMSGFGIRALINGPPGTNPTAYDTEAPAANPFMTISDRSNYLLTEIHDPNPGLWNVQVMAATDPGIDFLQTGFVTIMAESADATLHLDLSESAVTDPLDGVTGFIMPRWDNGSLLDASVTATLIAPDGSLQALVVKDGLESTGDYWTKIDSTLIPWQGLYELRVQVSTPAGTTVIPGEWLPPESLPYFERTASKYFVVGAGTKYCPPNNTRDCDGDGLLGESTVADGDADGLPDACDRDSDNDEVEDAFEITSASADIDGDGIPNSNDPDADGDGVHDSVDPLVAVGQSRHLLTVDDAEIGSCNPVETLYVRLSSDETVSSITLPLTLPANAAAEILSIAPGPDVPAADIRWFKTEIGSPSLAPGQAIARLTMKPGAHLPPANNRRVLQIEVSRTATAAVADPELCPSQVPISATFPEVVVQGSTSVFPDTACGQLTTTDLDADLDGVANDCDNCPYDNNPAQTDVDEDGVGDACDFALSACADGVDNDGDGLVDHGKDPGCESLGDGSENSPLYACDDGLDNDGDGGIDYQVGTGGDSNCGKSTDSGETP